MFGFLQAPRWAEGNDVLTYCCLARRYSSAPVTSPSVLWFSAIEEMDSFHCFQCVGAQYGQGSTSVVGSTIDRVEMVAVHGSRVSEPSIDGVRFAGGRHGVGDGEAPPASYVFLGGAATDREVSSIRTLVFV